MPKKKSMSTRPWFNLFWHHRILEMEKVDGWKILEENRVTVKGCRRQRRYGVGNLNPKSLGICATDLGGNPFSSNQIYGCSLGGSTAGCLSWKNC